MTTLAELFDTLKYRVEVDRLGNKRYYTHSGQLHREDGPAVILKTGSKFWFRNGELHRTDGPAVTWTSGNMEWWIHGVQYTNQEYCLQLKTLEHTCLLKQNYLKHSGTVLQWTSALVYVNTTTIQANCTVKMGLL